MAVKKVKEQGLSKKQMENAYLNYLHRYNVQKEKMIRKGTYMHDPKIMTFNSYKMSREALVRDLKERGKPVININQTLVSKQQYEFSMEQVKGLRSAGQELGLNFADESLMKLRGGRDIRNEDLSLINNKLKELYPYLTGVDRARWIYENIFAADSE